MEETESNLKPGYALDRYELLCPLATGGMATVWLARMRGKRGFEKLFAIKTIRAELSDDSRFEEMFLDEARIASGIQHPNVAQILDLGEKEGVLYLVMEWVDGESLARVRRFAAKTGVKMPLGLALRAIADSCAGLHAAHELKDGDGAVLGVVHRDVSPQNILIATSGAVKIIDFGIAKAENRAAPKTRTGIVKGKLQYMAPEQARAGKIAIDRRVDLWALGVCLYELVAERLPFDGENQFEILAKVTGDEPLPPIEGAPKCVCEILERSIARDRDQRFPTAASMKRAIEAAITELDLPSTSDDIALFVEAHLPERAEKRKELVGKALKEAAQRAKEQVDVFTGTVEVIAGPPSDPKSGRPTVPSGRGAPSGKGTAVGVVREVPADGVSEASNATLNSAALAASAGIPSRSGWFVRLLAVGAVAAGGYFLWQKNQPLMVATPATPANVVTAVAPSSSPPPPPQPTLVVAPPLASAVAVAKPDAGAALGAKNDAGVTRTPVASGSGSARRQRPSGVTFGRLDEPEVPMVVTPGATAPTPPPRPENETENPY